MRLLVLALVAFCSEAADPRFSELWNDIRPIYAQTLKQPFLTGIADGTLPRSHFQFYLTQDAKYLRVFGEVLSVLAAKAPRVEWAILLNQHAINSVKEERTLNESILRSYGVPLATSRDTPMAPVKNLLRMLSGSGIEDEAIFVSGLIEVKHLIDGAGDRVKTPLADALPTEPVVLDEPNHGCLVGRSVVYEILPRPRRDD